MIKVYETLEDLLVDKMPMICLPFIILILRCTYNIVKEIVRGPKEIVRGPTVTVRKREEKIKGYDKIIERLEKEETQINIDKDLQKYFNYKE